MIRLIQRRLIIPRGDTGSFTIPVIGEVQEGNIAVFSIYDPLTKKTVFEKNFHIDSKKLTVSLNYDDTVNLQAKKYFWDIKLYRGTIIYSEDDNDSIPFEKKHVVSADFIDSYYAAYRLPICEIKEVAKKDVL